MQNHLCCNLELQPFKIVESKYFSVTSLKFNPFTLETGTLVYEQHRKNRLEIN